MLKPTIYCRVQSKLTKNYIKKSKNKLGKMSIPLSVQEGTISSREQNGWNVSVPT